MRAAVGFSVHTGWSVAVVVSDRGEVIERLRIELSDPAKVSRFVFHAAALDLPHAKEMVELGTRTAREKARAAIARLRERHTITFAAFPQKKRKRDLPELSAILAAHPLLHAAEGELYRTAIAMACEKAGVAVVTPQPMAPDVGPMKPPWGKDQKDAAALAFGAFAY